MIDSLNLGRLDLDNAYTDNDTDSIDTDRLRHI